MKNIPIVRRFGCGLVDVTNYNLTCDDVGQFAVIQWGYNTIGIGIDRESAIKNAAYCMGCDDGEIEIEDGRPNDGSITVEEICLGTIDDDGNINYA